MLRGILSLSCVVGLAFLSCSPADAAKPRHLVQWLGATADHTAAIQNAVLAAMDDNGVVEFAAGRTYHAKWMYITSSMRTANGKPFMPSGVEGNGAILKATTGASHTLFYTWLPQDANNPDFFVRNLTMDSNYLCDYSFRVWGAQTTLLENCAATRANLAGVLLQATAGTYSLSNVVVRQVIARNNDKYGFEVRGAAGAVTNLKIENCYAHYNESDGFYLAHCEADLVGCGAEVNDGYSMVLGQSGKPVSNVNVLGGYTERNFPAATASSQPGVHQGVYVTPGAATNVRIVGGRLIGKFTYDSQLTGDSLIHSYGHASLGFNGQSPDRPRNQTYDYSPVLPSVDSTNSLNSAYFDVPDYFSATNPTRDADLLARNVVLVKKNPPLSDYKSRIDAALLTAGATNAAIAFEPGQTYPTSAFTIQNFFTQGQYKTGPAGVIGNGATLTALGSGSQFINCYRTHGVIAPGDAFDKYNFFMRNLTIVSNSGYTSGLKISGCKWFLMQDLVIGGGSTYGIRIVALPGDGVYYNTFSNVASSGNGTGMYLDAIYSGAQQGISLANVGFHHCLFSNNSQRGILCEAASVTLNRCELSNNGIEGFRANKCYSTDLIDCDVLSNGTRAMHFLYGSSSSWSAGGHVLGGNVSGTVLYDPAPNNGYSFVQSMIHTQGTSPADYQHGFWLSGANGGKNYGSIHEDLSH
ncbi:right-handed parallel beta-helix repeat-containing protein [Stieleria varia]|uniref:Right handed beta helix domain-containing protein n=1 Tax=Stieleria varia TaxID=2528005 RepID=A0A5C6B7D7_9BACT|nr:right-handed parallel beta-helix repeat-containing protein [Stieleria varia]TWU06414.1 hypothetical protein Pla52n_21350 [Stieleria varia]